MNPYVVLAWLSGVPALVYQVVWTREVGLLAGSQIEGISVVLAAFFGGLAWGSRRLGVRADAADSPLRLYARLELGAGALALLSLALLRLLGASGAAVPGWGLLALGALAIVPVTFLLGGTLPALLRAAAPDALAASQTAGGLVAANTAGALVGVALAALGAPRIGLAATFGSAAALALALGAVAWRLAGPRTAESGDAARRDAEKRGEGAGASVAVLLAAAVAGVATLGFEALAARAAALRLGSSLLAWAWVLGLVLAGLAAGNAMFARPSSRSRDPARELGWLQAGAALALVLALVGLRSNPAGSAAGLSTRTLVEVGASLLPSVFLMGGAFPFFVRLAVRGRSSAEGSGLGGAFGLVSASNTAGGIVGSLLAPLVLLPALGLERAILACAGLNALLGAAFLVAGGGAGGLLRAAATLAATGAAAAVLLAAPPGALGGRELLFVHHGRQATAAVVRVPGRGGRDLYVDGDPEASTSGDARRTEQLLALLPLTLHPDPESFLEVGLGSGITLGTATRFPLERIDCVEISDSVLRAAHFFEPDNAGVASGADARVRILREDGRAFLARAAGRYDVVVANTVHPWSVGAAGLYSKEYFQRLSDALREGGIALQWLPVDRIGAEDLGALVRTFYSVFDDGAVYWGSDNLLLFGTQGDLPRWSPDPEDAERFVELGLGEYLALGSLRLGSAAAVRGVVGPEPLVRDDRPILEARGALGRAADREDDEIRLVERFADAGLAPDGLRLWLAGVGALRRGDPGRAERMEQLAEAEGFFLARRDRAARLAARGREELAAGRLEEAEESFREALAAQPGSHPALRGLSQVALRGDDLEGSREALLRLLGLHPWDAEAWNQLAELLYRGGNAEAARKALDEALDRDPYFPGALANAGLLALDAGDRPLAEELLERLAKLSAFADLPEERALRAALAEAGP